MKVYGQSFQLESEKVINWFSVLVLAFINRSDKGEYFRPAY